jgi:hypothetical protein
MTLKERRARIDKHIEQLRAIFPALRTRAAHDIRGVLALQERLAHRAAERLCDDSSYGNDAYERAVASLKIELRRFLGLDENKVRVIVNSDPRGHALKIDDGDIRKLRDEGVVDFDRRDWGGYGIIWPDFDD